MRLLEKEAMVFPVAQVPAQQTGEQGKELGNLLVRHPLDQGPGQGVVSHLLQVVNQGVFVGLPIEAEADESVVFLNEAVEVGRGRAGGCPWLSRG
jgi:hypothetical protein